MNIEPIGLQAKINSNNNSKNVAFKGFNTGLTKEIFEASAKDANARIYNFHEGAVQRFVNNFWNSIEELKTIYANNERIDLKIFKGSTDDCIYGVVSPSEKMAPKLIEALHPNSGQITDKDKRISDFQKQAHTYILNTGGNLVHEINQNAKSLEETFKKHNI